MIKRLLAVPLFLLLGACGIARMETNEPLDATLVRTCNQE